MMFTGYFDDSGHLSFSNCLVCAGWVATVDQWKGFEEDWRVVTSDPKFDIPYLHMKEFRNYRGRFEKFKDNLPLQTELFQALYRLLEDRAEQTFGATVVLPDYEKLNQRYQLEERYKHPFALAGMASIHTAVRWMERVHPKDRISFVFDHDTDGWGHLLTAAKEIWVDEIIPVPGSFRKQSPLQASDHVAWEKHRFARQAIESGLKPKGVTTRGSLDALMAKFQNDKDPPWIWLNERSLEAFCEASSDQIPRRS
jgi:hypothetical protein